jgi:hypothetical protein
MRFPVLLSATFLLSTQAMAQSRFQFDASVDLLGSYDDNLFYRHADREEDFVSRLSGRLGAGYRSATLRVRAHGALDAEAYREHPELNTAAASRDAGIDLRWAPSKRVVATAAAAYAEAQTSGQLNTITGLETGRFPGRRLLTSASLSHRLGARTTAIAEHVFTSEKLAEGPVTDLMAGGLGIKHRFGPLDEGRMGYSARRFVVGPDVTVSHVATVGWTREVTPTVRFELDAGPRRSGRTVAAEASAAFRYRSRRSEVAIAYLRTQSTVLGQPGPVMTEGVSATFGRQLLRSLRVAGGPALFRVGSADAQITVARMNVLVGWSVTRHLSVLASHQFSFQRGEPGLEEGPGAEVRHNKFWLSIAAGTAAN